MPDRLLQHTVLAAPGAEPERWLYMLHGIYGAGRNWSSIARRVVSERTDWGVVLVDLREHGGSRGFPPPHTLGAAAGDLRVLAESTGRRTDAILGHSFGGKVALAYARDFPGRVRQLWIVDSTPAASPPSGGAREMLEILRRHPGPFPSRDAAVQALVKERVPAGIAQWMATNVEARGDEYGWRLDFDAMEAMLQDFARTDLWRVVEAPTAGLELHFVRATRSAVLTPEAAARIEAAGRRTGRVHLHLVEGGHWLNADNPDAVVELLVEGLAGGPSGGTAA